MSPVPDVSKLPIAGFGTAFDRVPMEQLGWILGGRRDEQHTIPLPARIGLVIIGRTRERGLSQPSILSAPVYMQLSCRLGLNRWQRGGCGISVRRGCVAGHDNPFPLLDVAGIVARQGAPAWMASSMGGLDDRQGR